MESPHCSDTPGTISSVGHPEGFGKSLSHAPAQVQPSSNTPGRLFSSRSPEDILLFPPGKRVLEFTAHRGQFLPKLFPDPFYCTMGRHPFPAPRGSGDKPMHGVKSLQSPGTSSETSWGWPQQAPLAGWSCGMLAGARILRPLHIRLPLQTPGTPCPAAPSPAPPRTAAPPLWVVVDSPFSALSVFSRHQPLTPLPHLLLPLTLPFLLPPTRPLILHMIPSPFSLPRPSQSPFPVSHSPLPYSPLRARRTFSCQPPRPPHPTPRPNSYPSPLSHSPSSSPPQPPLSPFLFRPLSLPPPNYSPLPLPEPPGESSCTSAVPLPAMLFLAKKNRDGSPTPCSPAAAAGETAPLPGRPRCHPAHLLGGPEHARSPLLGVWVSVALQQPLLGVHVPAQAGDPAQRQDAGGRAQRGAQRDHGHRQHHGACSRRGARSRRRAPSPAGPAARRPPAAKQLRARQQQSRRRRGGEGGRLRGRQRRGPDPGWRVRPHSVLRQPAPPPRQHVTGPPTQLEP